MKLHIFETLVITFFSIFLFSNPYALKAQKSNENQQGSWVDSTLFSSKLFIENQGQYDSLGLEDPIPHIQYAIDNKSTDIYFSKSKIAYLLKVKGINEFVNKKLMSLGYNEDEDHERKEEREELLKKRYEVRSTQITMEWLGSNSDLVIKPMNLAKEYFNYSLPYGKKLNFVKAYKKIVYLNIYDNIDIEYIFHPKKGIKYNVIVHPGGDINQVKLKYTGADKLYIDENGNVIIKTELGTITDHAPISFQANSNKELPTKFVLTNNVIHFDITDYNQTEKLIIDPWLENNVIDIDTIYDIAVDPAGNVFIYGTENTIIKKYNNAGIAQWVYIADPDWLGIAANGYYSDVVVDPSGNAYISKGGDALKLDPSGIQQWLTPSTSTVCSEVTLRLLFDATKNLLIGVGASGRPRMTKFDPATGNILISGVGNFACKEIQSSCTFCTNSSRDPSEIRHLTQGPNGTYYGLTAGFHSDPSTASNTQIIGFDDNATTLFRICDMPSIPYWVTPFPSRPVANSIYGAAPWYYSNNLAVSTCNAYTNLGDRLNQYDLFTGNLVNTTAIPGGIPYGNSGTLVDLANNVYVGGANRIYAYNPSLSLITFVSTPNRVLDMAFVGPNSIAAAGKGFVGVFNIVQNDPPIVCTNPTNPPLAAVANFTNFDCATGASAWVDLATITGGVAPYSYLWNNGATTSSISGISPGTYIVTITDSDCPQENTTLTVIIPAINVPVPTSSFTNVLCFGGNDGTAVVTVSGGIAPYSYLWSTGQTTDSIGNLTAGSYTIIVTDSNSCVDSTTITITEPSALSLSTSSTITNCNQCDGTVNVIAAGGTPSYQYQWLPGNYSTPFVDSLCGGIYTITTTDSNGCQISENVVVIQSVMTTVAITSLPTSCNGICDGSLAVDTTGGIGGIPPYTFIWKDSITNLPIGQTGLAVINLCSGGYYIEIKDANGCDINIGAIVNQPPLVIIEISNDTTICSGTGITLLGNGGGGSGAPYSYSWSDQTGIIGNTSSLNIAPIIPRTYYLTVTDSNNCSQLDSVFVDIFPPLSFDITPDFFICEGEAISLSISNEQGGTGSNYTYNWSNGFSTIGTTANIVQSPFITTAYYVTVTNACESVSDSIVVQVYLIAASFVADTQGCIPFTTVFTNTTPNSSSCNWIFGDGSTGNNCTTTHTYLNAGSYDVSLIVTDNNGCIDTLTKPNYINVWQAPIANFTMTPNPATVLEPTVSFTDLSQINIVAWEWSYNNFVFSNNQHPIHIFPKDTGRYVVSLAVTNLYGCADTISYLLIVKGDYTIYVPNSFTIDGDGLNDVFIHKGIGISEDDFTMMIFDRWGELIFETHDRDQAWDGTANGGSEIVPTTVYVWKIKFKDINNLSHTLLGKVTIIK